jgi:hypothetical protein
MEVVLTVDKDTTEVFLSKRGQESTEGNLQDTRTHLYGDGRSKKSGSSASTVDSNEY